MGADQQFCLRWNNFHTNITSAFESLRDDEDFVDITLACEGKQVKAHKMVLSACSPYFRNLLKGNPCQHPIVFLKDVTFANLTSILDFMYHGEVNVSHNELATFLKTAEALKVRGLAEDDKKKDCDGYNESSSPGPQAEPPDTGGGSPRTHEASNEAHFSDSPPPYKRQRRRSGASAHSAEDTNETVLSDVREPSVKNEPQEYNNEEDILGHHSLDINDIKQDSTSVNSNAADENDDASRSFGLSESVSISRNQAAMQQLQESFGSFLPAISQSPSGFHPHGAQDISRPPSFSLDGVQGLPPGISALPGPSMSQGGSNHDASQGGSGWSGRRQCRACGKLLSSKYALQVHIRDVHSDIRRNFSCSMCGKVYASQNSYRVHMSLKHRHDTNMPPQIYSPRQRSPHPTSLHQYQLGSSPPSSRFVKQEINSPSSLSSSRLSSPSPHSRSELSPTFTSQGYSHLSHSLFQGQFSKNTFSRNLNVPSHSGQSSTNDSIPSQQLSHLAHLPRPIPLGTSINPVHEPSNRMEQQAELSLRLANELIEGARQSDSQRVEQSHSLNYEISNQSLNRESFLQSNSPMLNLSSCSRSNPAPPLGRPNSSGMLPLEQSLGAFSSTQPSLSPESEGIPDFTPPGEVAVDSNALAHSIPSLSFEHNLGVEGGSARNICSGDGT